MLVEIYSDIVCQKIFDLAPDGTQALELFSAIHPDLVLLDMMPPGIDGI